MGHLRNRNIKRILVLVIVALMLTGCGKTAGNKDDESLNNAGIINNGNPVSENNGTDIVGNEDMPSVDNQFDNALADLSDTQRNSINMLNYITVLTSEINDSKSSRVYIETAYSSLINNTFPNAVDSMTQVQISNLLETLDSYRMISTKRERLQFIYEQNCASAIRSAIPNPTGLLSAVVSGNWIQAIISVLYMAADSYTSYTMAKEQTELQYLQDGWELNDEEASALYSAKENAFTYMIEMVRSNDLPGEYALNDDAVNEFVKWKNNPNVERRIEFLESNQNTYVAYGEYWLVLAKSYYEKNEYKKCLQAINIYKQYASKIFRHDYNYAKVLPLAIASAREVYDTNKYIEAVDEYSADILQNIDSSDWESRYFVAQAYIDLFAKNHDYSYLQKAYECIVDNVNYLVDEQNDLNAAYLNEINDDKPSVGATRREKEEIKELNKMRKELRKTELPPVSQALYLNCELLFPLSDELGIDNNEKKRLNNILHENGNCLFLVETIDKQFTFNYEDTDKSEYLQKEISFTGKQITLPVAYVSNYSQIIVTVEGDNKQTITDWNVSKVNRKNKEDYLSFEATFTSDTAKKIDYSEGDLVTIEIISLEGNDQAVLSYEFRANDTKKLGVFNDLGFEPVK